MLEIVQAESELHYQQVRELIAEYMAWDSAQTRQVGLDAEALLEFFYQSADEIPAEYAPPEGRLLLATYAAEAAGCGAFRRLNAEVCEVKRLYVRPAFRGKSIGKSILLGLIEMARQAGYKAMYLETASFMKDALNLYQALGFRVREPYYTIPEEFRGTTVFMELDLRVDSG